MRSVLSPNVSSLRRAGSCLVLCAGLLATGCASVVGPLSAGQKLDPWETWNRKVFAFNEGLDAAVIKPVATVYRDVLPEFARQGVSNFFNNVADAWSAVNLILQARVGDGLKDGMRFLTNTVFGFGGVLDVAGEMGMEHHYEDFGQTLGKWGVGPGAYIVWPLLGPSSVRETIAMPLDRAATPALVFDDVSASFGVTVLQVINVRASLLGASQVIDGIALDKYSFVRDAYLARRRSLVYDGDPPPMDESKDDDASLPPMPPAAPASAASGVAGR